MTRTNQPTRPPIFDHRPLRRSPIRHRRQQANQVPLYRFQASNCILRISQVTHHPRPTKSSPRPHNSLDSVETKQYRSEPRTEVPSKGMMPRNTAAPTKSTPEPAPKKACTTTSTDTSLEKTHEDHVITDQITTAEPRSAPAATTPSQTTGPRDAPPNKSSAQPEREHERMRD